MRDFWSEMKARERERPDALRKTADMQQTMQGRHTESYHKTERMLEDRYAKRLAKWRTEAPQRRERVTHIFRGRPERIEHTSDLLTEGEQTTPTLTEE